MSFVHSAPARAGLETGVGAAGTETGSPAASAAVGDGNRRIVLILAAAAAAIAGAPYLVPVPELRDTQPPRELGGAGSRFADVTVPGHGTLTVHYELAGSPTDRPAFLLLHNFFGSTFSWRRLLGPLGDRGFAVSYDRLGFGLTQRPRPDAGRRNPYTRAANADLAVGLLDELGVSRAVLVGSSAGGTICLKTVLRHPDRVAGLVLVSPAVNGDVGPPGFLRPFLRLPQARRLGPLFVRRLAQLDIERLAASYHDPSLVGDEDLRGYRRPLGARHWDVGLYETMVAEAPPRLGARLADIAVPSVVVAGASDATVPAAASRRTARALRDARFVEVPSCGHLAMEECPSAVLDAIDDFLPRVTGRPSEW